MNKDNKGNKGNKITKLDIERQIKGYIGLRRIARITG